MRGAVTKQQCGTPISRVQVAIKRKQVVITANMGPFHSLLQASRLECHPDQSQTKPSAAVWVIVEKHPEALSCVCLSLSFSTDADEKGHRTHVTQHTAPRSRQSERAPSLSTSPSGSSQAIRASAPLNQISGTPRHQAYVTVPCMCSPWAAPQLKVRLIQINWNANEFERTWKKSSAFF